MIIRKAYKVKLYPNKAQEAEMLRILAGCRFVWNYFLKKRMDYYLECGKTMPYKTLSKELTAIRKTAPELGGLQSYALQQSLRRLEVAYNRFFKKLARSPRYKVEWDERQSFQKCKDWCIKGNKVQIQKSLCIKTRGRLPVDVKKLGTVIVKLEAGEWYASILVQEEARPVENHTDPIGIDVGLSHLVVTSEGKKVETLKPSYELHHRMKVLQQKMERQEIGSNRREETRKQIAKLYQKIRNIRTNHLHQASHKLLGNKPSMIAIEDLNVLGMIKNRRLSRSLVDVSLGELHRQLTYKQLWNGGKVVEIGRFFPSTKTCSNCGQINNEMTLAIRNWTCASCGAEHDRDVNAAKVILQQGLGKPSVEGALK